MFLVLFLHGPIGMAGDLSRSNHTFRSIRSAPLILDFTVPRGSPIFKLISEWLSPETYVMLLVVNPGVRSGASFLARESPASRSPPFLLPPSIVANRIPRRMPRPPPSSSYFESVPSNPFWSSQSPNGDGANRA